MQVLVEQCLKLFVLLVQQACLLDQILSVHQQLVVVAQRFIEGSPHGQLLIGEDLGHRSPVHALLLLLAASVARLIRRLGVLAL